MRMLGVLLCVASVPAFAEPPHDLIEQPLVLAPEQIHMQLVGEMRLAPDSVGTPLVIAPDAWFGVTRALTIGLVHSDQSLDRFAATSSICVRTDVLLCDHPYKGGAVDGLWQLRAGHLAIAAHARLMLRDIAPAKPAMTLGAALRYTAGRFAVGGDPFVQIGLANTDRGNDSELWLPIYAAVQPLPRWVVEFHTGFNGRTAVLTDGFHVPIGFATRVAATPQLEVGAAFGYATLLGPQNTPKERTAFLSIGWRS